MEKEEKITLVIYTESLFQSIIADMVSLLMLVVGFGVNALYIQSKIFSAIVVVLFLLKMVGYTMGRKTVFTNRQKAIDFINSPNSLKK